EADINSLALRLKGKKGQIRKNTLGKRCRMMCRTTITGDPRYMIDEVGVPLSFARTVQVEDHVQEYNKQEMMMYVQNGRERYPGATKIISRTGAEYTMSSSLDYELQLGDIVMHDLVDGTSVGFNRQPSLLVSNISCHRAKVIPDANIKVLPMNVVACKLFGADFDGDQMNLIIHSNI